MRACIYARVSSQAQKERHTIDSQLTTLRAFIAARGWTLVGTFIDDGRSAKKGATAKRVALFELHRAVQAGGVDVVCVVDIDRLTTRSDSWIERGMIFGPLQDAATEISIAVSGTGQVLQFGTDECDLMLGISNWQSGAWMRKHKERILRGKLEAISKGKKPAGPTPFGYSYTRSSGLWLVDPVTGAIVLEIFQRVAGGESCEQVAVELQARGVPRPRSGSWNRERVWQIVRATTYMGEWVADKVRKLTVPVPRIVEEDLYRAANDRLLSYGLRGLRRTKHVYLCEEIARCAVCSSVIGISSAHNRRAAYYVCRARRRQLRGRSFADRCELPMRQVVNVDERLWAAVSRTIIRPDVLERAIAVRAAELAAGSHDWAGDLERYEGKLRRLEATESALLERFSRGMVNEAALDKELARRKAERLALRRQVETARAQLSGARRERTAAEELGATLDDLRRVLPTATPEERRDIVRVLIPGDNGRVVTLGAESIEARLVLAPPVVLASAAGWRTERGDNGLFIVELRVVA